MMRSTSLVLAVLIAGLLGLTSVSHSQEAESGNPIVVIDTNLGRIEMEVFVDLAPITAGNFLNHVEAGFYDGLIFHRVVKGFVVQGGDPLCHPDPSMDADRCGSGGSENTVPLEVSDQLSHDKAGVVALARRASDPDSGSAQFYITLDEQPSLDGDYAIFGQVVAGLEVVLGTGAIEVDSRDRPLKPVIMQQVLLKIADLDGDGVEDSMDFCPDFPGQEITNGC